MVANLHQTTYKNCATFYLRKPKMPNLREEAKIKRRTPDHVARTQEESFKYALDRKLKIGRLEALDLTIAHLQQVRSKLLAED